jgi:ABC-type transport system involved in multi-copper enzyme maturation permease subunit
MNAGGSGVRRVAPAPGAFAALAREAVRDGIRRRIVPAIVGVCLLSLAGIDSCTSCAAQITINGQTTPAAPGWTALVLFVALGLWTMILAGLLAADHLATTLEDGSARLVLARPVARETFVGARLAGVLAVALVTGAVLLGMAVALLRARLGVTVGPALIASLAVVGGTVTSGALVMALSLVLPRVASILIVLAAIPTIAVVNIASGLGAELGGAMGVLDRFGPPLASAMMVALAPWFSDAPSEGGAVLALRLGVWAVASLGLLVVAFRRTEL